MTQAPGKVTHCVLGKMRVQRPGEEVLMHLSFLGEAALLSLLPGHTRRQQRCRPTLLDEGAPQRAGHLLSQAKAAGK